MFTFLRPPAVTLESMMARTERLGSLLAGLALALALAWAQPASAAPYGQLESWGKFGTGAGEFSSPLMAGVDPSDGSLYVGDLTKESAATEDREYYRIQKLSPSGTPLASVEIPRYSNIPTNTKIVGLWGIAVDPALKRLYVLRGAREKETFGEILATEILVFSTVPEAGKLVPPEGGPSSLPVPAAGAAGLYKPRLIQVDPSNGDLVIMAESKSSPKHVRFQRISSSGVTGKVFVDTADSVRTGTETAFTFTVGPDGTIYTMAGTPKLAGKGHTRAWEVPPSMESIGMVPGFAEAADSEEWSYGFESAGEGTSSPQSALAGGPEIAISPGETLYWKERVTEAKSEELKPGNMLVRGFSLDDLATTVVYGGGEAGKCKIETSPAGLGTVGGKVVVFDYGPLNEEKSLAPAYGPKVRTYGPGGSDCLAPVAKFKANGVEGDVKVKKGDTVSFDASPSELGSGPGKATPGFRRELVWDFGDGSEETIKGEGGGEAPLTASHKYTVAGTFEASLQIRLKNPNYGNPATVSHKVEVEGAVAKEFVLKVSKNGSGSGTVTSSPAGISCGGDCEESYLEGTLVKLTGTPDAGSKAVEWKTCPGTVNGSNQCEVTMDAAKEAKAAFDLQKRLLKVTKSGTGSGKVTSSPAGVDCGSTCEAEYDNGTLVKLTGTPDAGSKAVEWKTCPGTVNGSNQCEVTMDAAKEAKAAFDLQKRLLKVTKSGTGSGKVTSSPAGVDCGSTCEAEYDNGTLVKLTGTPDAGSKAVEWKTCPGTVNGSNQCEVTMDAAKEAKAAFDLQKRLLKVTKSGTGSGKVTSSPAGVDCGSTCEAEYDNGTLVKLTGTPDAGSKAVEWKTCPGTVNGSNQCEVTMDAAKEAKAAFDLQKRLLKVTKSGTGSGKVTSSPAGVNCGSTCEAEYDNGTLVKLTGTPDAGSKAVEWKTCPGTVNGSNQCEVTMDAAKEAKAAFDLQKRLLKVTKSGTGSGKVTSSPAGVNCGSTCEAEYDNGTLVKLTGTPDAGSKAVEWKTCPGTVNGSNQCEVTMDAAKEAKAAFTRLTPKLAVTLAGSGTGSVASSPAGIECGADCTEEYDFGTVVKLTGTPGAGTKPVAWAGCDSIVGSNECEVTMDAAKSVTASFSPLDANPLVVSVEGTGSGTVTSSPAGIECEGDCSEDYAEGTVVKLAGTSGPHTEPVAWAGCDSIVGANECEVTMDAAKNVTATFDLEQRSLAVGANGTGSGTVASSPAGIDCGADCEEKFDFGTVVNLTGTPDPGSKAVEWETCPGTVNGSNECEVTMDAAKEAVATFDVQLHPLAVTVNGTGSGTVTSSPAGIDCGGDCEAEYEDGTLVKLTGTPDPGSEAVVWQTCPGTVNGSNECEVTVDAAKEAKAAFEAQLNLLKVVKNGAGSGNVTSSPAGIDCGATCAASFAEGALVTLTGTPDPGSEAVEWESCPGTVNGSNQCEVTMDAAKEAKATFDVQPLPKHLLKVTKSGTGSGNVSSSPAGIDCGSDCEEEYDSGTLVKLTGTPDPGSEAVVWQTCPGTVNGSNQCEVTMGAAKEAKATFEAQLNLLKVTKSGTGTGKVTSSPAGIDCGGDCSEEYTEGTLVKLTGTPDPGSEAVEWESCPGTVNGSNQCEVTVDATKEAVAAFEAEPAFHPLEVAVNGTGSGTVTSSPAGIECGGDCEEAYLEGTVVKLTGTPDPGSEAVAWQSCPGTVSGENKCEVTMDAAREAVATFEAELAFYPLTVSVDGTGSGEVSSSPAGIDCGSDCEEEYDNGTLVKLTGTPDPGSEAVAWQTCPGTVNGSNQCEVTMGAAKEAKATFDLQPPGTHELKVAEDGTGSGTVTSSPAGIECGEDCTQGYTEGTLVKLTGTPGAHTEPVAWKGCDEVLGDECEVTMGEAREVTATFPLEQHWLTVVKTGAGRGWVASAPAGIGCGGTCLADFDHGESVILTATSGPDTEDVAWLGCDAVVSTNRCQVAIDADTGVTAVFGSTLAPVEMVNSLPAEEGPVTQKKKRTARQRALARCRKLHGKARVRCVRRANRIGRKSRNPGRGDRR